jgi:hypothetical protein
MSKKPLWKKRLTLNQPLTDAELEHCLELFDTPTCKVTREEDGEHYLTACRFDKLAEADKVSESATKLTTIMKAIVKVEHGINHPENGEGSYSGIFERRNDEWHEYVNVKLKSPGAFTNVGQIVATVQNFDEDGSPMPQNQEGYRPAQEAEEPAKRWYQCLVCPCKDEINSNVFDALYHFAEETSYYSLYKVYEIIKTDTDNHPFTDQNCKMINAGWTTFPRLKSFKMSANCYGVTRSPKGKYTLRHTEADCRSQVQSGIRQPYLGPFMDLSEAEQYVRCLLKKWLEWIDSGRS